MGDRITIQVFPVCEQAKNGKRDSVVTAPRVEQWADVRFVENGSDMALVAKKSRRGPQSRSSQFFDDDWADVRFVEKGFDMALAAKKSRRGPQSRSSQFLDDDV